MREKGFEPGGPAKFRRMIAGLEKTFEYFGLDPKRQLDWVKLSKRVRRHLGQRRKRGRPSGSLKWTADKLLALAFDVHEAEYLGCSTNKGASAKIDKEPHTYGGCAEAIRKRIPGALELQRELNRHAITGVSIGQMAQVRQLYALGTPRLLDMLVQSTQRKIGLADKPGLADELRKMAKKTELMAKQANTIKYDGDSLALLKSKLNKAIERNIAVLYELADEIERPDDHEESRPLGN